MSANTKIEWADHTFNPWVGCTKISPACDHCYAEGWAKRSGKAAGVVWGGERRRTSESNWQQPLVWNRHAEIKINAWDRFRDEHGLSDAEMEVKQGFSKPRRPRVFCASLADVCDNEVPVQWRVHLLDLIHRTPHLDWLLLTKRIGNAQSMLSVAARNLTGGAPTWWNPEAWPNIWIGATICNQAEADRDIPKLLAVPAAKRFLSIEPMLGPVDIGLCDCDHGSIPAPQNVGGVTCPKCNGTGGRMVDWVIVGGESGPKARPMHPDWVRSLRDQCVTTGTPFLFKQWGKWAPFSTHAANYCPLGVAPDGSRVGQDDQFTDDCALMYPFGKEAAGRMLDGREWDEVPA